MRYTIGSELDGTTVKKFLFETLGFSGAAVTALKKRSGGIVLRGEQVTVRAVLRAGDILDIVYEDSAADMNEKIVPTEMPLTVLYESDDEIVVSKPAHTPTHPSHGHFSDTLANGLSFYFRERGVPFVFRAVNRLDSETSGAVIVAKNKPASAILAHELISGEIKKRYVAVLRGTLPDDFGELNGSIGRMRGSVIFRALTEEGDRALTRYRVLLRFRRNGERYTAVLAEPVTGRTHQLRVHFASIGHPIVGDGLYPVSVMTDGTLLSADASEGYLPESRLMLHACSVSFFPAADRDKKHRITVRAELPPEIAEFLPEGFSCPEYTEPEAK